MYRLVPTPTTQRSPTPPQTQLQRRQPSIVITDSRIIPAASPLGRPAIELTTVDANVAAFAKEVAGAAEKYMYGEAGFSLFPKARVLRKAAMGAFRRHPFDISIKVGGNIVDDQAVIDHRTPKNRVISVFMSTEWHPGNSENGFGAGHKLKLRLMERVIVPTSRFAFENWLRAGAAQGSGPANQIRMESVEIVVSPQEHSRLMSARPAHR